ncbi:MAG TPA: hypothetical protein ENJ50_10295, partial [Planctomycetaceae bacterium]|nr:hypothetical protein [Planctomycetaceae bacterium]
MKSKLSKKLRRRNRVRRLGGHRRGMQMELLETRQLLAGINDFGLPPAEGESDGGYVPGEVLIRFRDGITEAEKQALVDDLGFQIKEEYRYVNSALLGLPDDVGLPTALLELRQDDRVR